MAIDAGVPTVVVVLMGAVTGTVGGILRDVLCDETPLILRREIYASVVLTRLAALRWDLHLPSFRIGEPPRWGLRQGTNHERREKGFSKRCFGADRFFPMSYVRCLQGLKSGATYPADRLMNTCPVDGRPVAIRYDLDRLRSDRPVPLWYHPARKDMWRFGGLLPLDVDDPADRAHVVSLGEGATPRLDYPDHPAAQRGSFRLRIKDEGRYGADGNPTGSFKDRGMAVVVSMARRLGLETLAVPTQGNAGDALAAYGVEAGLEVGIAMPRDTDRPILGNVAAADKLHDEVDLTVVEGTIREAGTAVEQTYLAQDYFLVATFQEPGWRIEGKKTMGLELAEPSAPDGEWSLPDVIVYPTGGGTGILGMWKAFEELEALGLIGEDRPRMVSVQSTETAPIVEAFRRGDVDTTPVEPGTTMATGLNVADGIGHFKVLDILYESDGHAIAVSESSTAAALRRTYHEKGWWICPEGAACLAALNPLVDRGVIQAGDDVVVFNTASLEKYLPAVRHLL